MGTSQLGVASPVSSLVSSVYTSNNRGRFTEFACTSSKWTLCYNFQSRTPYIVPLGQTLHVAPLVAPLAAPLAAPPDDPRTIYMDDVDGRCWEAF